ALPAACRRRPRGVGSRGAGLAAILLRRRACLTQNIARRREAAYHPPHGCGLGLGDRPARRAVRHGVACRHRSRLAGAPRHSRPSGRALLASSAGAAWRRPRSVPLVLFAWLMLAADGRAAMETAAIAGIAAILALVSWRDDLAHLAFGWRLIAHLVAA